MADKKYDNVRIITNPLSSNKTLDAADAMIENILSKKQVFIKKSPNSYPLWLTPGSDKVPSLYDQVWKAVRCPTNPGFCNTPILSHILMSSGVTTQSLGYIWNLVNKKYIGILTEEELYLTLALIAISQNGTVVRDLEILKQIHEPIIPRLDLNIIKHYQTAQPYPQPVSSISQTLPSNIPLTFASSNTPQPVSSKIPQNLSANNLMKSHPNQYNTAAQPSSVSNMSPLNYLSDPNTLGYTSTPQSFIEEDDEFTDFQSSTLIDSAPLSNVSITLNPIHYLMSSSPTPTSERDGKNVSTTQMKSDIITKKDVNNKNNTTTENKINATHDEDDFTDFQSSLDFDVEIKQPNLIHNIKTMIDTKTVQQQRDSQALLRRNNVDGVAAVSVDNIKTTQLGDLKIEQNSIELNTNPIKLNTVSNTRDYSALKDIQLNESLFEQESSVCPGTDMSLTNQNIIETNNNNVLEPIINTDTGRTKDLTNLLFDNFKSMNIHENNKTNNETQLSSNSMDLFSNIDTDNMNDDFDDFKQAAPLENIADDFTEFTGYNMKPNYDINVFDLPATDSIFPDNTIAKNEENLAQIPAVGKTSSVDILFDSFPSENTKSSIPEEMFNATNIQPPVFTEVDDDDDEFTNFEQAAIIDPNMNEEITNDLPEIDVDSLGKMDDISGNFEFNYDVTKDAKEESSDKYSALRGLDFGDDEDSDVTKDMSDGDNLSLQDKDRDTSDGDNVSLQLPCVTNIHDQDTIQAKCFDACIYTLETSLNLFLSSQIENSVFDHPKVIEHFKCLAEVYQVGKRLQKSGVLASCNHSKLDATWNRLSTFCSDATSFEFNQNQNEDDTSTDKNIMGERCEICLCENNRSLVEKNNVKYHPQCINLYLHCVDATLPCLPSAQ